MNTVTKRGTYVKPPTHRGPVAALVIPGVLILTAFVTVLAPAARVDDPIKTAALHVDDPTPIPPITIAAVGDSITAFEGDSPVKHSWAKDLNSGAVVVDYTQGWAVSGTRLADMAGGMKPTTDDYVVIMGGVNDRAWPTTATVSMEASLEQIVSKSGLPADHIIVSAIAPVQGFLPWVNAWNADEQRLAGIAGWNYIDPWGSVKGADGNYQPQYTIEGVHPNDPGSALIADAISADVQWIAGPRKFVSEPAPMSSAAVETAAPALVRTTIPAVRASSPVATARPFSIDPVA